MTGKENETLRSTTEVGRVTKQLGLKPPAVGKARFGEKIKARFRRQAHKIASAKREIDRLNAALTDKETQTRAILEAAADGVVSVDEKDIIQSFNAAAEGIFGHRAADLIGQNVNLLMAAPYQEKQHEFVAQYHPHNQAKILGLHGEVVGLRKDGSTFPMELGISELRQGGRWLFIMILRDITNRWQAEAEIRRVNVEITQARDLALEASRAKSSFLANMGHELRTPLNAIIGYSELLQEEATDRGQQTFVPDLKKIHGAGRHLLGLINDILDLSKLEAGKMDLYLETFDIAGAIQEVTSLLKPLLDKNENRLDVGTDYAIGTMKADVTKVRQILFNLLSNACKFTTQGVVGVRASRFTKDQQDWIRFQVTDTGIGISPQNLTRLFQDFSQADASTTRKYGGTGLGLSICRRLTRMMGGEITVDSEPGKGSTFTVELPAEIVAVKRRSRELTGIQAPSTSSRARAANTILVIDDDPGVHELIQRYLGRDGLRIVTTTSGEEGIRLARELRPGAITLDLLMPGMDGWSVLTALKADPELAGIPVTMLSILSEQNQAFSLGAADYLTKPIDRDQLAKVLQKYRSAHLGRPILVVEDDPVTREMMSRLVTNLGCLAVEAENGRVALQRVAENPPKLILLDLMMPEMDGFEFIERLQENESWRSIPVVVVTAMELTEEDQNRLKGGIRQMILKKASSSPEELLRNVRDLLAAS